MSRQKWKPGVRNGLASRLVLYNISDCYSLIVAAHWSATAKSLFGRCANTAMEGLFVASAASGQIILSTRFHPKAANLVPLALDALKASKDASVAWFPCPAAARPPAATNYDSDSSDDASDDATQAWAAGASNRIAGACVCCVKHTDLSFALVVSSNSPLDAPFTEQLTRGLQSSQRCLSPSSIP
jgi:hypothetical protein